MNFMTPDKFGYYEVGPRRSYSKLEAAEWNRGKDVHWNFNDSVFSSYDWTKEPSGDLWQMYLDRAVQIRSDYDYVAIFYSGGADSHNILKSFIESDSKIDEIVTYWDYPTTRDPNNDLNAEVLNVVLPHIKSLQEQLSYKFKHTLIDLHDFQLHAFNSEMLDYHYTFNFWWPANSIGKTLFRDVIPHYKELIKSKRLVFVYGMDKPFILWDPIKEKYYQIFHDLIDDHVSPYHQRNYNKGYFDEFFYWAPESVEMIIKQCHIVKRFLEISEDQDEFEDLRDPSFPKYYSPKTKRSLKLKSIDKLIYPKWDTNTFSIGKPFLDFKNRPSGVIGPKDIPFLQWQSDASVNYLKMFKSMIGRYRAVNHYGTNRIKPYYSNRYYLS